MKTSERILLISLDLFNSQGERNVTSVDIACELDISPGNLYYHYKGKEQIVKALVEMYCKQMDDLSKRVNGEEPDLKSLFCYLLLSLETLHLFRFIFQNIAELSSQYPGITKTLQRNATTQNKILTHFLSSLQQKRELTGEQSDMNFLLDIISLTMYQSLNYFQMQGTVLGDPEVIYRSLMTIFFSVQPFYNVDEQQIQGIKDQIINKSLIK